MKQRLINFLLRHLLTAITIDEIISNDPKTGVLIIDGQPVTPNEYRELQAEIKALEGFRIWKILTHTTKQKAEEKIFVKSVTIEDTRSGKAMLFNLDLQNSIINAIKKHSL